MVKKHHVPAKSCRCLLQPPKPGYTEPSRALAPTLQHLARCPTSSPSATWWRIARSSPPWPRPELGPRAAPRGRSATVAPRQVAGKKVATRVFKGDLQERLRRAGQRVVEFGVWVVGMGWARGLGSGVFFFFRSAAECPRTRTSGLRSGNRHRSTTSPHHGPPDDPRPATRPGGHELPPHRHHRRSDWDRAAWSDVGQVVGAGLGRRALGRFGAGSF